MLHLTGKKRGAKPCFKTEIVVITTKNEFFLHNSFFYTRHDRIDTLSDSVHVPPLLTLVVGGISPVLFAGETVYFSRRVS